MTSDDQQRQQVANLFAEQRFAVLATHRTGQPHGSLVAFAANDDLTRLLFATSRASQKFANLCADPRVSLLIDNRENLASDVKQAIAVTAIGEAEELDAEQRASMQPHFLGKHPYLGEFLRHRDTALVSVRVRTYYVVSQFQRVVEIKMQD